MEDKSRRKDASRRRRRKRSGGGEEEEEDEEEEEEEDDATRVEEFGFEREQKLSGRRRKAEKMREKKVKSGGFESMELPGEIFRAIKRKGYRLPTPIQRKAIPVISTGVDVVAMARTGSGKTVAFVIPVLAALQKHSLRNGARALILAPTRELALQTFAVTRDMAKFTDLRLCALVGGDSMEM